MSGIMNLTTLLKEMSPVLCDTEYVFCSLDRPLDHNVIELEPICTMMEEEGLTVILTKEKAEQVEINFDGVYKKITLYVHSSLEAVGLTAAFSKALTDVNISANVVAGYYHDHIFVPKDKAEDALDALLRLTGQ